MKAIVLSTSYKIPMSIKQFEDLVKLDFSDVQLGMEKLNVHDIEYDGHFGPNFYCTISGSNTSADRVIELLEQLIQE